MASGERLLWFIMLLLPWASESRTVVFLHSQPPYKRLGPLTNRTPIEISGNSALHTQCPLSSVVTLCPVAFVFFSFWTWSESKCLGPLLLQCHSPAFVYFSLHPFLILPEPALGVPAKHPCQLVSPQLLFKLQISKLAPDWMWMSQSMCFL